jgi:hypothetical protein
MQKPLPKDWAIVPLGKLIFQKKDRYSGDIKEIEVLSVTMAMSLPPALHGLCVL